MRWVGGKQLLVTKLLGLVPPRSDWDRYFEPFVGAGSMFFALAPKAAFLSDLNRHLIGCYTQIRDNWDAVWEHLDRLARSNSAEQYLVVRREYNSSVHSAEQAARFVYLNRTCFNGIFRVNRNGAFNVPYGHRSSPTFPTREEFRSVAQLLSTADLRVQDFEEILGRSGTRDFVYLDPPYPPLNGTSYFTHYTPDRFDARNQERLARAFRALDSAGCLAMLSNADTPRIRELYAGFEFTELRVTRYVTCKSDKHKVDEVVVTNYPISSGLQLGK